MRANGLIDPLGRIAASIEELLSLRSLAGERAQGLGDEVTRTLAAVGDRSGETDRDVAAVLRRRADGEDGVEPDDPVVDRLERIRRVRVRGNDVIVPLGYHGPPAHNWGPTFDVAREMLDAALERATTLANRSRAGADAAVGDTCVAARRMLETLRDVIVRAGSGARVVERRTARGQDAPLRFAEWTSGRLNGDDDA